MHFKFVVDVYFNSFAAYFTTSVYTECMGEKNGSESDGSESDGSNFFDTFCFLF